MEKLYHINISNCSEETIYEKSELNLFLDDYRTLIKRFSRYDGKQCRAALHGNDFSLVSFGTTNIWNQVVCETSISIKDKTKQDIMGYFQLFDNKENQSEVHFLENTKKCSIFIGHGHSEQWRELKDHLQEKHGYHVRAYEVGSRSGHSIRDILTDELDKCSFALMVMTGEDEYSNGKVAPRLNVVHETGLFQGVLGFSKAIILLEDGTEEFSNIHGIDQIRYSKGNIKETFGDVLAVLKREKLS